jgi:hypothetical protein
MSWEAVDGSTVLPVQPYEAIVVPRATAFEFKVVFVNVFTAQLQNHCVGLDEIDEIWPYHEFLKGAPTAGPVREYVVIESPSKERIICILGRNLDGVGK